jgi:hypothetical protein
MQEGKMRQLQELADGPGNEIDLGNGDVEACDLDFFWTCFPPIEDGNKGPE